MIIDNETAKRLYECAINRYGIDDPIWKKGIVSVDGYDIPWEIVQEELKKNCDNKIANDKSIKFSI